MAHIEIFNGEANGGVELLHAVEAFEGDHEDLVALVDLQVARRLLVLLATVAVPQVVALQQLLLREVTQAVVQTHVLEVLVLEGPGDPRFFRLHIGQ